jgi:two-component system, NarL family, response regulator NreC
MLIKLPMQEQINIGIVEDNSLFREGLKAIINGWPNVKVVFEASEGYSVIENLVHQPKLPDVMIIDLSLPQQKDGKEYTGLHLTQALLNQFPHIKIIILSVHMDENFIVELIENGAHSFLVKDCNPNELYNAIVGVCTYGSYINERALKALQHNLNKKKRNTPQLDLEITKREIEILQLVCEQLTAEEIADKLFISVKTVKGHRNNLLQKTGSRNATGLVIYAFKNNLITLK